MILKLYLILINSTIPQGTLTKNVAYSPNKTFRHSSTPTFPPIAPKSLSYIGLQPNDAYPDPTLPYHRAAIKTAADLEHHVTDETLDHPAIPIYQSAFKSLNYIDSPAFDVLPALSAIHFHQTASETFDADT